MFNRISPPVKFELVFKYLTSAFNGFFDVFHSNYTFLLENVFISFCLVGIKNDL